MMDTYQRGNRSRRVLFPILSNPSQRLLPGESLIQTLKGKPAKLGCYEKRPGADLPHKSSLGFDLSPGW